MALDWEGSLVPLNQGWKLGNPESPHLANFQGALAAVRPCLADLVLSGCYFLGEVLLPLPVPVLPLPCAAIVVCLHPGRATQHTLVFTPALGAELTPGPPPSSTLDCSPRDLKTMINFYLVLFYATLVMLSRQVHVGS